MSPSIDATWAGDIRTVLAEVSMMTGFHFSEQSWDGGTSNHELTFNTWSLQTGRAGETHTVYLGDQRHTWISQAAVLFDMSHAKQDVAGRHKLIRHEIGHAMGLAHVEDRSEIMHPLVLDNESDDWGAGTRQALDNLACSHV